MLSMNGGTTDFAAALTCQPEKYPVSQSRRLHWRRCWTTLCLAHCLNVMKQAERVAAWHITALAHLALLGAANAKFGAIGVVIAAEPHYQSSLGRMARTMPSSNNKHRHLAGRCLMAAVRYQPGCSRSGAVAAVARCPAAGSRYDRNPPATPRPWARTRSTVSHISTAHVRSSGLMAA